MKEICRKGAVNLLKAAEKLARKDIKRFEEGRQTNKNRIYRCSLEEYLSAKSFLKSLKSFCTEVDGFAMRKY